MNNFGTLVRFELKKILGKKITWIAFGLVVITMLAAGIYRIVVTHEVDGVRMTVYEEDMQEKTKQKQIVGRTVDDEFLEDMFVAMVTDETAFEPYKNFYNEVARGLCGTELSAGTVEGVKESLGIASEEDLIYAVRRMRIEDNMEMQYLTEEEKEYWRKVLDKEDTIPWTYDYYQGVQFVWVGVYTAIVLIAIMLAVCLANLFAEEHQKRTDQLVLCSRNGKKVLYWAKITAGMLFTMVSTGIILLATAVPQFLVFGADGLHAPIQLLVPVSAVQMSFGEIILYVYIMAVVVSFLYCSIVLCGSELFRNSTVAVVAIMVILVLIPMMIVIPYEYRVLAQFFELNPINVLALWSTMDYRLVPFANGYLTVYQVAPVLYIMLIVLFLWVGRRAYLNYQVKGR